MSNLKVREKLLEREYHLENLGPIIVTLTKAAEDLANAIEGEGLIDQDDPTKVESVAFTNDVARSLVEVTDELTSWLEELTTPWEEEESI